MNEYIYKINKVKQSKFTPLSTHHILSAFRKMFEKCVYKRVYSFLEKNLIFMQQFGFMSGYSSNHTMVNLVEIIKTYIDNDNYMCSIFIDLEKALDTVDYQILLQKLYHYGIRGLAQNWFRSYLSNRQRFVFISGSSSEVMSIKYGVPQGSTLGPLWFLLYISDLNSVFNKAITMTLAKLCE